jgi:hypothetical protein
MEQTKNEKLMACTNLDELINVEYGEPGTELRRQFDACRAYAKTTGREGWN